MEEEPRAYKRGDECELCSGPDIVPLVSAVVLFFVMLITAAFMLNRLALQLTATSPLLAPQSLSLSLSFSCSPEPYDLPFPEISKFEVSQELSLRWGSWDECRAAWPVSGLEDFPSLKMHIGRKWLFFKSWWGSYQPRGSYQKICLRMFFVSVEKLSVLSQELLVRAPRSLPKKTVNRNWEHHAPRSFLGIVRTSFGDGSCNCTRNSWGESCPFSICTLALDLTLVPGMQSAKAYAPRA